MSESMKHDDQKLDLTIVPPELEEEACRVLMYGEKKYARHNYRALEDGPRRYFAALERHLKAFKHGYEVDEESQLDHLSHAAACLAILLHLQGMGKDIGYWRAQSSPLQPIERVATTGPYRREEIGG